MALTDDAIRSETPIKIMSNYWTVFGVLSALIFSLVLEVSLVNVSGFSNPHNSVIDIPMFSALGLFSIISQLIILNFVRAKIVPNEKLILRIMHMTMVLTQLVIIVILVIILIQINFTLSYYLVLLELVFMISSITAVGVMGLLSYKFITWSRLNMSRITIAYLLASSSLSVNAIIGMVYVSDQLGYISEIVQPKPYGRFIMHSHYSSLADLYAISSSATFLFFWLGTVFLLQSYRKRLGTIKFWVIMIVPLLYFLSQFQPLVSSVLFDYSSKNPALFSIVYVLMLEVSAPMGGILFGLSFILVARKIQNEKVKAYLVVSGIGLLLLLVSYRPQEIITAPFPPFGVLSASFMGLSSYLIFVGIYSSALSVSQDSKLRASIRKSVEAEVNFIGNIASAEMTHKMTEIVKAVSEMIPNDTGVATSLSDTEIKDYINEVIEETKNRKPPNSR